MTVLIVIAVVTVVIAGFVILMTRERVERTIAPPDDKVEEPERTLRDVSWTWPDNDHHKVGE